MALTYKSKYLEGVVAPHELTALAQQLRDNDEVRYKTYELDVIERWQEQGARLEMVNVYTGDGTCEIWGQNAMMVWNAVMADFEAGNIGVHVLQGSTEKEADIWYPVKDGGTTTCELEFRWSMPRVSGEGIYNVTVPEKYDLGMKYWYMQIVVKEQSAHTREVLELLLTPDNRYQDNPNDNPLWRSEG